MIENTNNIYESKTFKTATREEWEIYYKVRRERTMWDVIGYLGWQSESHFITCEEAKDIDAFKELLEDGILPVTRGEFLFMCEYIEEMFNTENTIWGLADEAYGIIRNARDYKLDYDRTTIKLIEGTIYKERFGGCEISLGF